MQRTPQFIVLLLVSNWISSRSWKATAESNETETSQDIGKLFKTVWNLLKVGELNQNFTSIPILYATPEMSEKRNINDRCKANADHSQKLSRKSVKTPAMKCYAAWRKTWSHLALFFSNWLTTTVEDVYPYLSKDTSPENPMVATNLNLIFRWQSWRLVWTVLFNK